MSNYKEINTILIANRGEISSRVIRTCKQMGIRSVAVFSDADRNMPFVVEADQAIYIGASNPAESYLDQDKIINAAKQMKADAIHPGYGFLSENVSFARRCQAEGIIFIGPHPDAIEAMGSKSSAKTLMITHNVPTVPGYQGEDQSMDKIQSEANRIGYPVLLKAAAGGGGKGMRIVQDANSLEKALNAAKREALNAFGDDEMIIEKYIQSGRHIEFQIFGDQHGHTIHLLERECTIQRRYQKVIEESPSPVMSETLREEMGAAAVNAAKALRYDNAGTVEFIYDDTTGQFYFLEVNTRLQVEHPVTEEITGLDLVQMQIESAMGLPLSISQSDVKGDGYAIEVRLYAENADQDFNPVTGRIEKFHLPILDGLRVESAVNSGSEISIFYDPMIAKIIVHDSTRQGAHRKMKYALRNMVCSGTVTNQGFLLNILEHPDFAAGSYNTDFITTQASVLISGHTDPQDILNSSIAATLFRWQQQESQRTLLRGLPSAWRNSFYESQKIQFTQNKKEVNIRFQKVKSGFNFLTESGEVNVFINNVLDDTISLSIDGVCSKFTVLSVKDKFHVHSAEYGNRLLFLKDRLPIKEVEKVKGGYESVMPAQVMSVLVKPGQSVSSGDSLLVVSSMKMESTIESTEDGIVEEVFVSEGQSIEAGYLMLKINSNNNS